MTSEIDSLHERVDAIRATADTELTVRAYRALSKVLFEFTREKGGAFGNSPSSSESLWTRSSTSYRISPRHPDKFGSYSSFDRTLAPSGVLASRSSFSSSYHTAMSAGVSFSSCSPSIEQPNKQIGEGPNDGRCSSIGCLEEAMRPKIRLRLALTIGSDG
jgi:hypothetical protein